MKKIFWDASSTEEKLPGKILYETNLWDKKHSVKIFVGCQSHDRKNLRDENLVDKNIFGIKKLPREKFVN